MLSRPLLHLLRPPTLAFKASQRNLNLLEYQAKGLLHENNVLVQKFRMATNENEAKQIPKDFPCEEYVIKAQILAGGRGKGHFTNGFKVNVLAEETLYIMSLKLHLTSKYFKKLWWKKLWVCTTSKYYFYLL